jgi:hypothetical protein
MPTSANHSSASPDSARSFTLAGLRPTHLGVAVLLAVLAIGLIVEPGGAPGPAEAVEPEPLPEIPGGRAARVGGSGASGLPLPAAIEGTTDRQTRVRRELGAEPGATRGAGTAGATPARATRPGAGRTGSFGTPGGVASASAGALEVEPVIELGQVAFGASVERTIRFRNRGDQPVSILAVRTTCGCTAAEPDVDRLAPGASGTVRVVFTGKNAGRQAQFVRIVTDDPAQPVVSVRIRAQVGPDLGS